jgi:hypothetical protein
MENQSINESDYPSPGNTASWEDSLDDSCGGTGNRYLYHGDAVGLGGFIWKINQRPIGKDLDTQGASTIPDVGGHAEDFVQGTRFPEYSELVRYDSIRTVVDARFDVYCDAYVTAATSTIIGLSVAGGRLTVGALHAVLRSSHKRGDAQSFIQYEGTSIERMILDNIPVEIEFDREVDSYGTEQRLVEAYAAGKLHDRIWPLQHSPDRQGTQGGELVPRLGGYIGCSIVKQIIYRNDKATVNGHIITLPGFGTIKIGEMLIRGESKRLTLLRLILGSPTKARMAAAYVKSNGETL